MRMDRDRNRDCDRQRGATRGIIALVSLCASISACELIAGIDEKTAAGVGTPPTDAPPGGETSGESTLPPECDKHSECIAKRGENFICVKPEGRCQPLLNEDCEVVLAGARGAPPAVKQEVLADDNTIFFGFIMDLRGSGMNAGLARRNALELAAGDIHSVTRGIPGGAGGKRRPIAFVTCSETKDATSAPDPKVPARHLINDLHLPAILGASNSDTTIDLFNGEAFAKGTLVFSPNSLSSALSSPSDNGLFWRTSATSILQGKTIQTQVAQVEAGLGTSPNTKLAMVYIADAFGTDIFPHIQNNLRLNGAPITNAGVNGPQCNQVPCNPASKVFVKQYAANAQPDVLLALATEINTFGPDILVAIGRKDAVQISVNVEGLGLRPTHLYTQGSATADVTTLLTQDNSNGIRGRLRGTRPLAAPDEAAIFLPLYNAAFPQGPPSGNGVPGCYDITYLLTYGALAAPGDPTQPLTGARMNEGLKRVLDKAGEPIRVGTAEVVKGMEALQGNKPINVKGVSYIFDFDTAVGEAPGKVDVWCISQNTNLFKASGAVYDPQLDGGTLTGAFNCPQN